MDQRPVVPAGCGALITDYLTTLILYLISSDLFVSLLEAHTSIFVRPRVTMTSSVVCFAMRMHAQHVARPGVPRHSSRGHATSSRRGCLRGVFSHASSSSDTSQTEGSLTLSERKQLLIRLCANTDRGKNASVETAAAIETQVTALEALNETNDPAVSQKISGKWALIYTGASADDAAKRAQMEGVIGSTLTEATGSSGNVASTDGVKPRSTGNAQLATYLQGGNVTKEEGAEKMPLGRTIGTLDKKGLVENLGNFQDIYLERNAVENTAELKLLGVPLKVKIEASCVPVDVPSTSEKVRLAVAFQRVSLTFGSLPSLKIPLDWINDGKGPEGWLDTTYLDNDMRLGRGDKGSTFVTVRRK